MGKKYVLRSNVGVHSIMPVQTTWVKVDIIPSMPFIRVVHHSVKAGYFAICYPADAVVNPGCQPFKVNVTTYSRAEIRCCNKWVRKKFWREHALRFRARKGCTELGAIGAATKLDSMSMVWMFSTLFDVDDVDDSEPMVTHSIGSARCTEGIKELAKLSRITVAQFPHMPRFVKDGCP